MRGPLGVMLDRGLEQLPGLLFVAVGMSLLAGAVLVPAWGSNERLAQRHATLKLQAELIAAQRERYTTFHDALAANDPQLLQRLAYSQLHLRPTAGDPWPGEDMAWIGSADDRLAASASIDAALIEPASNVQPVVAKPAPPSRLVRLSSGFSRLVLIAAAVCFVVGGLGYGSGGSPLPTERLAPA